LILAAPASGQFLERATLIKGARIVTMDGPTIEKGDILIKGGKIREVAPQVQLGLGELLTARTVDAAGKTITPGFVDAWSALGRAGAAANPDATATAWDAFDQFSEEDLREALRNGVTSVYIGPGGQPGIVGSSIIVHLAPSEQGGIGRLGRRDAALCINLGSEQATIARVKTFSDVRKKFRTAVEYRKAHEDYEEELKEYLEKLEERRKKKESEAGEKKDTKPEGETKEGEKPKEGEPAPKPGEGDKPKTEPEGTTSDVSPKSAQGPTAKSELTPPGTSPDAKGEEKKNGKKEDELKKPTKPKHDPTSEVLLLAIDHELSVRVEAHRSSDILNALTLAKDYNVDLILEGATEAYLVANQIAEAKAPVVLGQVVRTDLFEQNECRRHSEATVAELSRAGVTWAVGSGGDNPQMARFVGMNAQLAAANDAATAAHGGEAWMYAITAGAAKVLGLHDVGRIAPGMRADLLIWSSDPADPGSRLEKALVSGELAFEAAKEGR
jgi:imidazolonepropionase-like amidohydrolase